ncbi:hypothetical protein DY000_02011506 [Brassica cretica]|uniref:S-protein homolog n=1 Tax=Brassica cretica TaxID=69181 RepID=A0ABQ7DCJ8_BRACR|nr:hypothetical protein DY000_02011506 [Brassica cretica]
MNYLILFILVTVTYFRPQEACVKNRVVIHNELGPGRILEYHCYSNRDDLGIKNMAFNATPYVIAFHDEIFYLTTWNCLLRQGPNNNNKFVYDVQMYKAGPRLIPRCGQIRIWTATIEGIYFARDLDTPPVLAIRWIEK